VLYRYFLPVLLDDDVKRICNGMRIYVNSMMAAKVSPFALNYPSKGDPDFETAISDESVKSVVIAVPEVLLNVLQRFRGVEAFYQVKVRVKRPEGKDEGREQEQDTREILKIEELQDALCVNCLFDKTPGQG